MMTVSPKSDYCLNEESNCEGLSLIASDRMHDLENYISRGKRSYDHYGFDGNLYSAFREVYAENRNVLDAMELSIKDRHCTKLFYNYENTVDQIQGFLDEEVGSHLWNVNVRVGCALVKESLKIRNLKPIMVDEAEDCFKVWTNPKASAGAIKIGSSKRDCFKDCFDASRRIRSRIRRGKDFDSISIPCVMFHRAQISGFNELSTYSPELLKKKDRFIWGMDGGTVTVEGQYAKVLIQHLSENWYNYAGGKDPETLRQLIGRCYEKKNNWTSIDYSKFDQTIPSWLLKYCFDMVKEFFDEEYWTELDWICYNFINTRVAIPGKGIYQKHHGIPSGSNFTQIIGSMANAIMMLSYVASCSRSTSFQQKMDYVRKEVSVPSGDMLAMFVMGDDNLVFTASEIDLDNLSKYVHAVFGVNVNPTKCDQGGAHSYPTFLKRVWKRGGEWQDPLYLTVNSIHPEHKRTYNGYSEWHIMYGFYLTYSYAFPSWVSERYLIDKMERFGGVQALECIPKKDLPGIFKSFGDDALKMMAIRAERLLQEMSA